MEKVIDSDFSGLEGTNCYCSAESMAAIRREVARMPLHAVHKIGTGDYHYVSLFWLERIDEPFVLFLFDNHSDDQPDAFGTGMLSCGGWVMEARKLDRCKATVWYDGQGSCHVEGNADECTAAYLSIDLDILSDEYARTNWNQGEMTLEELTSLLSAILRSHDVIGVDLCGGLSEDKGASREDSILNAATEEALIKLFLD